jgi:hypothetical protein
MNEVKKWRKKQHLNQNLVYSMKQTPEPILYFKYDNWFVVIDFSH